MQDLSGSEFSKEEGCGCGWSSDIGRKNSKFSGLEIKEIKIGLRI